MFFPGPLKQKRFLPGGAGVRPHVTPFIHFDILFVRNVTKARGSTALFRVAAPMGNSGFNTDVELLVWHCYGILVSMLLDILNIY